MLDVTAIRGLDEEEEVYTDWYLDSAAPEEVNPKPSSETVHGVHQLTGLIRIFENGCLTDQRPIRKMRHGSWKGCTMSPPEDRPI